MGSDKVLGTGFNGKVYQASSIATGELFAVKTVNLKGVTEVKKKELQSEVEIFMAMDHPHIARLVDVFESPDQVELVMECMSGGELYDRVHKRHTFSEQDAAAAVWQMLLAINYMHSLGVVHRDIKLENFLYEHRRSNHLKLIDFGFSKILLPDTKMSASCGTLAYVAPEVLRKNYTNKCDMWSLGVVSFALLVGHMPFQGQDAAQVKDIKAGRYLYKEHLWVKVSKVAHEFVEKLLIVAPEVRLSAQEALQHRWIVEHKRKISQEHHFDDDVAVALASFSQASKFRRACLYVMAMSIPSNEERSLRNVFLEMDKGNTGLINLSDFRRVLAEHVQLQDSDVQGIFEALDINNSDQVDYSEFLAAMVFARTDDELLRSAFRRFDVSNTGFISEDDLHAVLGEETADVRQIVEVVASQQGQISLDDFTSYMRRAGSDAEVDQLNRNSSDLSERSYQKTTPRIRKKLLPKVPSHRTRQRGITPRGVRERGSLRLVLAADLQQRRV